ncbi:MAG: hypothetical protein LBC04_04250 [Holosporaceae bacterium]|jgi:hypothetical protein|nr:hypothetical protein [Holosporaceae bacterium]
MSTVNSSKTKTAVIFLPEAGIYPYLRSLSVVGDALKKDQYKVYIIDCNGVSFRCPMMPNYQMPFVVSAEQKQEKCLECKKRLENAMKVYGFGRVNLREYVDEHLLQTINDLLKISADKWRDIEYRDLKVGQIAIRDLTLEAKVLSVNNLTPEQEHMYGNYIKNTALMIEITDRIIKDKKPSVILTYNSYAQCQAVECACQINGVNFKCITNANHLGANFSLFVFTDHLFVNEFWDHQLAWKTGQQIPISANAVKDCFDDAFFRMYGSGPRKSHIFSSAKVQGPEILYNQLSLNKSKKILGVFTSSYDELLGLKNIFNVWGQSLNEKEVFKNQIEWLLFLREFSKSRNDLQIAVRVHPREGLNVLSEHLQMLRKVLPENTENFKIIWPSDPVSSYDLMEIIDCCLISISTIGMECQRLGIPTLSCTRNVNYPDEGVIETACNIEEYKRKLENIIDSKCTPKEMINCIRYYNWRTFVNSLDMGESIPKDFEDSSVYPEVPENKQKMVVDILEDKIDLIKYNIERLLQANYSKDEELEAVKLGIRRVIDKLFASSLPKGKEVFYKRWFYSINRYYDKISVGNFQDYALEYSEDVSQINNFIKKSKKNNIAYLVKDGVYAIFVRNGVSARIPSKMAINLARIHKEMENEIL